MDEPIKREGQQTLELPAEYEGCKDIHFIAHGTGLILASPNYPPMRLIPGTDKWDKITEPKFLDTINLHVEQAIARRVAMENEPKKAEERAGNEDE